MSQSYRNPHQTSTISLSLLLSISFHQHFFLFSLCPSLRLSTFLYLCLLITQIPCQAVTRHSLFLNRFRSFSFVSPFASSQPSNHMFISMHFPPFPCNFFILPPQFFFVLSIHLHSKLCLSLFYRPHHPHFKKFFPLIYLSLSPSMPSFNCCFQSLSSFFFSSFVRGLLSTYICFLLTYFSLLFKNYAFSLSRRFCLYVAETTFFYLFK